jgi:hypothetical protein
MKKTLETTPKGEPECDHSPKHEQTLAILKQFIKQLITSTTRAIRRRPEGRQQTTPAPEEMALTFGTLLSSQRTDAHPQWSLNRLGGNPVNITRPGPQCQTARPDPTDSPPLPARAAMLLTEAVRDCHSPARLDRGGAT